MSDAIAAIEFLERHLDLYPVMDLGGSQHPPEVHPTRQLALISADATAPLDSHLSVEVEELDGVWQRALDLGAEIVRDRTVESWGVERLLVCDLAGNVVNLLSHTAGATAGR